MCNTYIVSPINLNLFFTFDLFLAAGCHPPTVELSLERSEFTVSEGIGKSSRALQICAVASDLNFGVHASLQVQNGSATGILNACAK